MKKWDHQSITALFEQPLLALIYQAQTIHRLNFDANEVELCTLLNIKTGACPENCSYCPQSGHYKTGVEKQALLNKEDILAKAAIAKEGGAVRFCMGGAWRSLPEKDFPALLETVKSVKALGLQTCLTAGMLSESQALALKEADLDYYNHNLDTSPEYYDKIITTHTYQDRLDTLQLVRKAGINVCCGGIMGLGESQVDRVELLLQLINLPSPPESIPINRLIPIPGTPLENQTKIENVDFIRMIAVTRIVLPSSKIRLSAGRKDMSEEMQAMCFMAGANSIHYGEKLLITGNPAQEKDLNMLSRLGLKPAEQIEALC